MRTRKSDIIPLLRKTTPSFGPPGSMVYRFDLTVREGASLTIGKSSYATSRLLPATIDATRTRNSFETHQCRSALLGLCWSGGCSAVLRSQPGLWTRPLKPPNGLQTISNPTSLWVTRRIENRGGKQPGRRSTEPRRSPQSTARQGSLPSEVYDRTQQPLTLVSLRINHGYGT